MTTVKHRPPQASSRSAQWAWVAVALTPVGLVLALVAGFAWGENPAPACPGCTGYWNDPWYLGTIPAAIIAVIAPTVAVILAIRAARAGERSGRAAVWVSVLLLLGMFVLVAVGGFFLGSIIALVLVAAVLGVFGWRSRHKQLPPAG